jgi:hypothetical protein
VSLRFAATPCRPAEVRRLVDQFGAD